MASCWQTLKSTSGASDPTPKRRKWCLAPSSDFGLAEAERRQIKGAGRSPTQFIDEAAALSQHHAMFLCGSDALFMRIFKRNLNGVSAPTSPTSQPVEIDVV